MPQKRASSKSSDGNSLKGIEPSKGFTHLPKGSYEGYIKPGSWTFTEVQDKAWKYKTSLTLVVDAGEHEGETEFWRQNLNDIGKSYLLGLLETLELGRPDTIVPGASDLAAESDNLRVRFYVTESKDEYGPEVYINELLEGEGSGMTNEEEEEEEASEETDESGDSDWDVGDACLAPFDGDMYPGKITEIYNDDTADVTFDDGDETNCAIAELETE